MKRGALAPEARALLAGARVTANSVSRTALAAAVAEGLDWRRLLTRAQAEGTTALLFVRLREIDVPVPAAELARLQAGYRATWARNIVLTERWAEAMDLFERHGVESITHKGVALIYTIYPDIALRPMADIDLLVRSADVDIVTRLLRTIGYRTSGAALEAEEAFRGFRHFVRDSVVIDLHWDLANYRRYESVVDVDHPGLWARARRLEIEGARSLTLSPEDMLLHLVLHLSFGSEFGRLIWFVDLDAALRRFDDTFDWARASGEAGRWRIGAVLAWTLGVLRVSFGTPMPLAVVEHLGRRRVRSALVSACIGTTCPPSVAGKLTDTRVYLAETLLMDRVGDVLRILWGSFFPSRDWVRFHYAATARWQIGFWRIVHPLRVVWLAVRRTR